MSSQVVENKTIKYKYKNKCGQADKLLMNIKKDKVINIHLIKNSKPMR